MNRRAFVGSLVVASSAGCLGVLRGSAELSVGETATADGLSVRVVDYTIVDDADLNSNAMLDSDASILLVEVRIEHTGGNKRSFPHPTTNGIIAFYDDEFVSDLHTSSNIVAEGTEYAGYASRYREAGANDAYKGTEVQGWVPFEVPPDADPSKISVTVRWSGSETHERTWNLG